MIQFIQGCALSRSGYRAQHLPQNVCSLKEKLCNHALVGMRIVRLFRTITNAAIVPIKQKRGVRQRIIWKSIKEQCVDVGAGAARLRLSCWSDARGAYSWYKDESVNPRSMLIWEVSNFSALACCQNFVVSSWLIRFRVSCSFG